MPDVILLGDINIDISATIPAYPARGGEGVANTVEFHTGGSVVHTGVALANMGVQTGIIGRIGADALAAQATGDLDSVGVDRSMLQVDPTVSTGLIYVVVNPDGERTMFSSRGANVFTVPEKRWKQYFASARWYHISGYALLAQPQQEAAIEALELARQNLCRVSLDPSPEPAMRQSRQIIDLLPKIDILLPNEYELTLLTKGKPVHDAIQYLLDNGAKTLVVKRGAAGCIIASKKMFMEIPALEVQVKNTTGAGDSFDAGVLLGRMVGLDWAASAILGNALGALAASLHGVGTHELNPRRVIDLLEQDMFKPAWAEWHWAIEQVLAYLSALSEF